MKARTGIGAAVLSSAAVLALCGCDQGGATAPGAPEVAEKKPAVEDAAKPVAGLASAEEVREGLDAAKSSAEKVAADVKKDAAAAVDKARERAADVVDEARAALKEAAPAATPQTPRIAPDAAEAASRSIRATLPEGNQESAAIVVEPEKLDLGDIATNDSKAGTVRLVNTGDVPRTLLDCKTSCGCTTANCQKGKSIAPGEAVEVEIKLSGGQRATKLNKTVTFLISDHSPIRLSVSGQAVSYVTVSPDELDPTEHPDGKLVLSAIDNEPFTIKTMYPPIVEAFATEPKPEHEVFISWEKLKEHGHRSTKILFTLDHPKCAKVNATLSRAAVPLPERRDPNRQPVVTPLFDLDALLRDGKVDEALAGLDEGKIDVNAADNQGQTPLVKAARWGSVDMILALLDASADIGVRDKVGRSPLMYASQSKNVEAVRVLLDAGASVTDRDDLGNTALCWAAGFGSPDTVREMLDAGAELEAAGPMMGFTPLIWASLSGEAGSVKVLIDAGANIEAKDVLQGATPLMHAVRTGGPESVAMLLEAGADIEARDNEGKTAMLTAASNAGADVAMIQLLIDKGADLSAKSHTGKNALEYARDRTDLRAPAVLELLEKVMGGSKEGGE